MSKELLKQCRDIIDACSDGHHSIIEHIDDELAKPEPEPVAKIVYETSPFADEFYGENGHNVIEELIDVETFPPGTNLYTSPLPRKQMSDDEIREFMREYYHGSTHWPASIDIFRAIEKLLMEDL